MGRLGCRGPRLTGNCAPGTWSSDEDVIDVYEVSAEAPGRAVTGDGPPCCPNPTEHREEPDIMHLRIYETPQAFT